MSTLLTQQELAELALLEKILARTVLYPVGAVFITTSETLPATQLGYGTWEEIDIGITDATAFKRLS